MNVTKNKSAQRNLYDKLARLWVVRRKSTG